MQTVNTQRHATFGKQLAFSGNSVLGTLSAYNTSSRFVSELENVLLPLPCQFKNQSSTFQFVFLNNETIKQEKACFFVAAECWCDNENYMVKACNFLIFDSITSVFSSKPINAMLWQHSEEYTDTSETKHKVKSSKQFDLVAEKAFSVNIFVIHILTASIDLPHWLDSRQPPSS